MNKQTRRDFLKAVGLGAASLAVTSCTSKLRQPAKQAKKPNVVFFFTDDQRFDTIAALGNNEIITPNMDYLVHNGTAFTNAYIMGGNSPAVCAPSRAMLMTGRTLFQIPQGYAVPWKAKPDQRGICPYPTFPEVFKETGYRTFATGKQHNGRLKFSKGFTDGGKIFFGGMSDHLKTMVYDFDPTGKYSDEKKYTGEKFSSEMFSDAAIDFLNDYKVDNPFLIYISYTAPHDPRMAPKEYQDMYDANKISLPKNFMPEHPFDNGELKIRDEKLASWPRTPQEIRRNIAEYYAMITHLDAQIGRVIEKLKKTGQYENTIIIFAGDNGLALGQHGLMGKQNLYEHSVHVPLIMSGPGIGKGQKRDAFCYLLDIFPTLCQLCDIEIPESVEGHSLAGVIRNPKRCIRKNLLFAYRDFQRAVRDKKYKLIEYHVKGRRTTQLFDIKADPWELNNLADDPKHLKNLTRLRKKLGLWKELGDKGEFRQIY